MLMSHHLEKRWQKLYNSSIIRAESLEPIKKKFADLTSIEIIDFCLNVILYFLDFFLRFV